MDSKMSAQLAVNALVGAVSRRGSVARWIVHSGLQQSGPGRLLRGGSRGATSDRLDGSSRGCRGQRSDGIVRLAAAEIRLGPQALAPSRSGSIDPCQTRGHHGPTRRPCGPNLAVTYPCSRPTPYSPSSAAPSLMVISRGLPLRQRHTLSVMRSDATTPHKRRFQMSHLAP